jgi:hypothetical protein
MQRSLGIVLSLLIGAGGLYLAQRASAPRLSPPVEETAVPTRWAPAPEEGRGTPANSSQLQAEVAPQAEVARLQAEVARLQAEEARLQAEILAVRQWSRAQERRGSASAAGRPDEPAPDSRPDPEARAAAERERHVQMEAIEVAFRHEPADQGWAFEAQGAVQAALASDGPLQNTLLGLECRSQTCRVELAEDDTGELQKALPLALQQLASTLPNAIADYVEDGAGRTMILYLSRDVPAPPTAGK